MTGKDENNMDMKKVGQFIAARRKHQGLTQEQLGEKLGVTGKTVSRWENGNYMPNLSLLEPLSRELEITLNELLAGEMLEKETIIENAEENLIRTIDYSARKINLMQGRLAFFIMGAGILLCISAFAIFEAESSWGSFYSIIGLLLFIAGLFRRLKVTTLWKKLLLSFCIFCLIFTGFLAIDYISVTANHKPPIFRYQSETIFPPGITEYYSLFCNVYRINSDTENEYYIVDREKEYTLKTVPLSPFNRDKSGIDQLIKYQSDYVGDNSNTGNLINNLPLSESGYVFEIDSQTPGLVIDYHRTDWYGNDDCYVEKSLLYNSVAIFALIDNVQTIQYRFSGASHTVTRDAVEQYYPNYEKVVSRKKINEHAFNQYVEKKMNDSDFIAAVFEKIF